MLRNTVGGFAATALAGVATLLLGACRAAQVVERASDSLPRPGAGVEVPASAAGGAEADPWLVELSLDFEHHVDPEGPLDLREILGPGAAAFDADGDGDRDLYLLDGGGTSPGGAPARNRLYLRQGDGSFVDGTDDSGLGDEGQGMGVALGDVDNDGDLDVYVANVGPDRLFRNLGDGRFEDVTQAAGIDVPGFSSSVVFHDHDADGLLDLLVLQYVEYVPKSCLGAGGRPDYCGPLSYAPSPDVLLRNLGDGRFEDVSARSGLAERRAAGLGAVAEDFDGDGRIDLFVANDAYPNHLWINQGDGTFVDRAVRMGVAYNLSGQSEAGMGVVSEDFDGDGGPDLFLTHLRIESNTLYLSRKQGVGYADATAQANLARPSMAFTGFGVAAFDLELDGDLDLAVANGRVNRLPPEGPTDAREPWDWLAEPNLLQLNDGRGSFESVTVDSPARAFLERSDVSRGLLASDLDGDGDEDLVVTNLGGPVRIYRNEAPRDAHWVSVRAWDPDLRRDALGARVSVRAAGRMRMRTVSSSSGYLTAREPELVFGLGAADEVEGFEVKWWDGTVEEYEGGPADRAWVLRKGEGRDR